MLGFLPSRTRTGKSQRTPVRRVSARAGSAMSWAPSARFQSRIACSVSMRPSARRRSPPRRRLAAAVSRWRDGRPPRARRARLPELSRSADRRMQGVPSRHEADQGRPLRALSRTNRSQKRAAHRARRRCAARGRALVWVRYRLGPLRDRDDSQSVQASCRCYLGPESTAAWSIGGRTRQGRRWTRRGRTSR
jgi:hypothetical protein